MNMNVIARNLLVADRFFWKRERSSVYGRSMHDFEFECEPLSRWERFRRVANREVCSPLQGIVLLLSSLIGFCVALIVLYFYCANADVPEAPVDASPPTNESACLNALTLALTGRGGDAATNRAGTRYGNERYNGIDKWDNPHYISTMTTKLTLDKAGRVSLPKALRQELHLAPGDSLSLESQGEQITLRPVRASMPIRKEDGVWVYRSGEKSNVSIRKLIEEGRDERHGSILGRK